MSNGFLVANDDAIHKCLMRAAALSMSAVAKHRALVKAHSNNALFAKYLLPLVLSD